MKTILTIEAIYDIAQIMDYIEIGFGADRAIQFQLDIETRLQGLNDYSRVGTGIRYKGKMICKDVFGPSLIFFVIIDDAIQVLRVLRHEQDWQNLLKNRIRYNYL